ncbi:MAG: hypothetical protein JHC32_02150 [Candidatus Aminicenantes bacterium]|nr:hypothetical protein [Candidatus Aminicenantes bacterium]
MKLSWKSIWWLLYLAAIFSLTNIIVHDYLCHEELHRLVSPVHHSFNCPSSGVSHLIQADQKNYSLIFLNSSKSLPSDFTPVIFHPPTCLR